MKLSFVLAGLMLVSSARASTPPDVGSLLERPVVNRCIAMLVGPNTFDDSDRDHVLKRLASLKVKPYSWSLLPRLFGFYSELPRIDGVKRTIGQKSHKRDRLSRLLRDLHDDHVVKSVHIIRGADAIRAFLDAQAVEASALDEIARPYLKPDYKTGRTLFSAGRIAAGALGVATYSALGGPLVGLAMMGIGAVSLKDVSVLGDRARYALQKARAPKGQQPMDHNTREIEYAYQRVIEWDSSPDRDTPRYFGVTSVIPQSVADLIIPANEIDDIPAQIYGDLHDFRATNESRWKRLGAEEANYLSADFIFTPSPNPAESELIAVARLARQYQLAP